MAVVVDDHESDQGHVPFVGLAEFHGDARLFSAVDGPAVAHGKAEGRIDAEIQPVGDFKAVHGLIGVPGVEIAVVLVIVMSEERNHVVGGTGHAAVGHLDAASLLRRLVHYGLIVGSGMRLAEKSSGMPSDSRKQMRLADSEQGRSHRTG